MQGLKLDGSKHSVFTTHSHRSVHTAHTILTLHLFVLRALSTVLVMWVPTSAGVQLAKEKKVKYGDRALAHMKGKLSPECVDLINRCMTVDPAKRPTAASALDHAWFQAKLSPEEAEAVRSSNSPLT
jgi:serine/threonine protein kinase